MPVYAPPDTLSALGPDLKHCTSRSLYQDRFADPQAKDAARKQWFNTLCKIDAETVTRADWLPEGSAKLHARLMSRLMVNLAGGVMENANVLLDRYGMPFIPGSAVKGCARRMALQALHDWVVAGSARPADDDVCAPCCEGFETPAAMLAAIARVFGWVDTDWSTEKNRDKKTKEETTWKSDFAWACGGGFQPPCLNHEDKQQAERLLAEARSLLPACDSFSGTIAFLMAFPNKDPGLELDVVTPHHTKHYENKPGYENAPDTEDPVPVYFPAVKPQPDGDYFTFPLIPLRLAHPGDLAQAKTWLAHGLEIFGLGAKTNAGYGWFDASVQLNNRIKTELEKRGSLASLMEKYRDFELWDNSAKEEAVLTLSDQADSCLAWQAASPESFEPVRAFAASLDIPLI